MTVPTNPTGSTEKRRALADRAARWFVTAGGLGIIASVLGILLFIGWEVAPLFRGARVTPDGSTPLAPASGIAIVVDEHRSLAATLDTEGRLRVVRIADGSVLLGHDTIETTPFDSVAVVPGRPILLGASADGRITAFPVGWRVTFDEAARVVAPDLGEPVVFEIDPEDRPLGAFTAQVGSGGSLGVAQTSDGSVVVSSVAIEENPITGEISRTEARHVIQAGGRRLTALVLDRTMRNLYGGTAAGELLWWSIRDGIPDDSPRIASTGGAGVTALGLLTGDRSVLVGRSDGGLAVWFQVRQADETFDLETVRDFPASGAEIVSIAPSARGRSFVALDAANEVGLYHATSGKRLWTGHVGGSRSRSIVVAPKSDAAYVLGDREAQALAIVNPHPEVSWTTLFGRVWYEGYPEPAHVWQSSGGTDDFEPKLGLTPLAFGTIKGTFYSLLLAVPLGVFGAMYAAHFMHPSLKKVVKPTIEIMAALPSVVLGFIAGLWLAPIVETHFPALLLMAPTLVLFVLGSGAAWSRIPRGVRERMPGGTEVALYAIAIAAGTWVCLAVAPVFEATVFKDGFSSWLLATTGLTYDQRNAIVVGLAMGFAVIPIIFAISEDAFANVPLNLVSGSLALGANRWQTATRVVLPTASPGIFSAVMIGFGRAVGETMIVLMATGNTPIMDWSPFNGFRTLSANIAVEIPEAPVDGTLYRTLFLAALLLFLITFVINTAAELIRQRLRRRYSQL